MGEPLIYTTKGNLPENDLRREVRWEFVQGEYVKCSVLYFDATGEKVKESHDVLLLKGLDFGAQLGM